jgi:porin
MVMFRSFVLSVFLGAGTLIAGSPTSVVGAGGEEGEAAGFDSRLTGDCGGVRTGMAEKGLTVDLNGIFSFQGVAGGGLNLGHDVGNVFSGNLGVVFDTEKAGLWPGGVLKARLEGRGGATAVRGAGATSPVNNQAVFPLVEGSGGSEVLALTELTFTQFLTEKIGLTGGLLNTTYGDNNPITGNAISNQHFMNLGFLYSPVEAGVAPAVTLGGGVVLIPIEGVMGSFTVFGSEETAGKNPFALYEGTTFATEWEFEHELGEKPGGMVFGGLYSVNQLRLPFGSVPRLVLEELEAGEEVETDADSWAVFWNGYQYLVGDEERGMGVFARAGLSDGSPNPVRAHAALGLGGVGLLPGREKDRWGAGMYYQKLADGVISQLDGLDDEIGGEVFYNVALTPWMHVTLDVQVIDSAVPQAGTVVVLGTRVGIQF